MATRAYRRRALSLAAALALTVVASFQCGEPGKRAVPAAGPVLIRTARAEARVMPVAATGVGTVVPSASVAIRPRVGGQLLAIYFTEGETVSRGQLLFQIDPAPFEASLRQARSLLASHQAQARDQAVRARRYQSLAAQRFVARDQADEQMASARALTATVAADRAAVESARLQLGYTRIRAPLTGVVGKLAVDRGNVVVANQTVLVTINQVSPIYVEFSVPESQLAPLREAERRGPVAVTARTRGSSRPAAAGTLILIDNQVDVATGTILLRARFGNQHRALWPGQFAEVSATLATPTLVAVPSQAIQRGQAGATVFVIGADRRAQLRQVEAGHEVGGYTAITRGLAAGELVATDGLLRLRPGAAVEIAPPAAPGES